MQFAPTARLVPQLLAKPNEGALVPVTAMLVIDKAAAPVLVIVTDCDALAVPTLTEPNERLFADSVTGPGRPVPLSAMVCGEVTVLSVMAMAAVNAPVIKGLKLP